jgi:hypothetical protein
VIRVEEKLSSFPLKARTYLAIGYVLRIFPIANIVGSALIPIGWFRINNWNRDNAYLLAVLGSILVLFSLVYGTFFAPAGLLYSVQLPQVTGTEPLDVLKNKTIYALNTLKPQLADPTTYLLPVIAGIGLLFEAVGVKKLSRDTKKYVPTYLAFLLLILAIIYFAEAPAYISTAQNIDQYVKAIESAKSVNEIYSYMIGAVMNLVIVGLALFFVGLITYILLGWKIWKIAEYVRRLRVLSAAEKPSKTGGEELLI